MFPTCRGNVVHTTAFLPPFHDLYGSEAHSQHCAIVGRRRALRSVAWWGGLGPPLSSHGRLLLGNLCKFGRGPHRCASAATIQHRFRIPPPGLGTLSGTATQHNHHSIPPKYKYIILPLKCAAFNPSNNSGQGKGRLQMISANTHSNFDRALTLSLLAQRPNFSEDLLNSL